MMYFLIGVLVLCFALTIMYIGYCIGCSHGRYEDDLDDPRNGRPDVIANYDDGTMMQDALGPFADNVLDKVKFLSPGAKQRLSKADTPAEPLRRAFFPESDKQHDCVQCYKDASELQRRMVLCPTCGNKRCPKALNHRYQCTRSNAVDQVPMFDGYTPISNLRINGDKIIK